MATLALIGMVLFAVLMLFMSITAGTQESISAYAKKWRWLLLVALWSQILILPQMITITASCWQFLCFMGIGMIIFCGGASIFETSDMTFHMVCAVFAFLFLSAWVIIINPYMLLPLIICACIGRENLVLRLETGLIISVYTTLMLSII